MEARAAQQGDGDVLTGRLDGAAISTFTLCILAVVLRVICRRASKAGLWWDDWVSVVAAVPTTVSFLLLMICLRPAAGHHITNVEPEKLGPFFKAFYVAQIVYVLDIATVKFSILLFYWRLFAVSSRLLILVMFGVVAVWGIVLVFFEAFQCNPVSEAWLHTDPSKCFDMKTLFVGGSVPNVLTDIILMMLPIPFLWRLHIRLVQRLLLGGVFIVGGFVAVVSIIRMRVLVTQDLNNPDVTYYMTDVLMWTMVEINIGLLCACLPSLRPVITFIRTGSLFSAPSPNGESYGAGTPGVRSRNGRGPKKLFSASKSILDPSRSYDEGSVEITDEDREMARDVGIDQGAWGKSQAGVEASMDDLNDRKEYDSHGGINVTRDWSVRYDESNLHRV